MGGRDVQPTLERALQSKQGFIQRPVYSSASSRWPQALVQNRKQLRVRGFVLAAWPSCSGPRQPAVKELGGGPVHHVRLAELERLAGPSAAMLGHAIMLDSDVTPRTSPRAERCGCTRLILGRRLSHLSGALLLLKTGADFPIGYRGMEILIVMHLIPRVGGWTRGTDRSSPSKASATLPTANIARVGHHRQSRWHVETIVTRCDEQLLLGVPIVGATRRLLNFFWQVLMPGTVACCGG